MAKKKDYKKLLKDAEWKQNQLEDRATRIYKEKEALAELIHSIRKQLWNRHEDHEDAEIPNEVANLKKMLDFVTGQRNVRAEALEQENERLFALVRYQAGDKKAFDVVEDPRITHERMMGLR